MQKRCNYIANAPEWHLFYIKPSNTTMLETTELCLRHGKRGFTNSWHNRDHRVIVPQSTNKQTLQNTSLLPAQNTASIQYTKYKMSPLFFHDDILHLDNLRTLRRQSMSFAEQGRHLTNNHTRFLKIPVNTLMVPSFTEIYKILFISRS